LIKQKDEKTPYTYKHIHLDQKLAGTGKKIAISHKITDQQEQLMTAKVKILWTRRIQRRKNKPYIAAKTYIVEYDGTLANLCTVLAYTIRRRQRLVMIIIDGMQLHKSATGKITLEPIENIPEINQHYPNSHLPYSRKRPLNPK
jgi:hypothetical protein